MCGNIALRLGLVIKINILYRLENILEYHYGTLQNIKISEFQYELQYTMSINFKIEPKENHNSGNGVRKGPFSCKWQHLDCEHSLLHCLADSDCLWQKLMPNSYTSMCQVRYPANLNIILYTCRLTIIFFLAPTIDKQS